MAYDKRKAEEQKADDKFNKNESEVPGIQGIDPDTEERDDEEDNEDEEDSEGGLATGRVRFGASNK